MEMDADAFEQLVIDELDHLPDEMVDGLDNVVFVVEEQAEGDEDLFGLYEGFEVHTTLAHEIAHFYGIDDARLHELGWA